MALPSNQITPLTAAAPRPARTGGRPGLSRRRALALLLTTSGGGLLAACVGAQAGRARPSEGALELNLGHFLPTKHEMHARLLEPWARGLEDRSGGRIKVRIHPGGALGAPAAQYQNVSAGAMDVAFGVQSYTPGRFPLTDAMELPFVWDSGEQATRALWELYRTMAPLQQEYRAVKVLGLWTTSPAQLLTTGAPVRTLEDLRGMKLRGPGAIQNRMLEALGAAPLSAPASELYDILERGVADGTVITASALVDFNLAEVVKHVTRGGMYVSTFFLVMNADRWESLDGEVRALVDETSGELLSVKAARIFQEADEKGVEQARKKGVEFYELPPDELGRWKAATSAIADQWVGDTQARGLPATEFYDRVNALARA